MASAAITATRSRPIPRSQPLPSTTNNNDTPSNNDPLDLPSPVKARGATEDNNPKRLRGGGGSDSDDDFTDPELPTIKSNNNNNDDNFSDSDMDEDYDDEEEQQQAKKKNGNGGGAKKKRRTSIGKTMVPTSNTARQHTGKVGSAGLILSIELLDFMCHRHMSLKFSRNINFITGGNGSGKSTVVTGLQVALGLDAQDTRRGKSLSDFVRYGASGPATVRVTLTNEGIFAYRPEDFGDTIIVERIIPQRGGGATKTILKSQDNKPIESGAKYLQALVQRFSMYVDNPCCVLDQENSKLFLKGKAAEKYKFFLKATELFKIEENYTAEFTSRQEAKQKLKSARENLDRLHVAVEKAEFNLSKVVGVRDLNVKVLEAEMMLTWATVANEEKTANDAQAQVEKCQVLLDQTEAELVQVKDAQRTFSEKQAAADDACVRALAAKDAASARVKEVEKDLQDKKQPITQHDKGVKLQEAKLKKLQERVDTTIKERDAFRAKLASQAANKEQERVLKQLAERRKEEEQLTQICDEELAGGGHGNGAASSMQAMYEEEDRVRTRLETVDSQLADTNSGVQNLQQELVRHEKALVNVKNMTATKDSTLHLAKYADWLPPVAKRVKETKHLFKHPVFFMADHIAWNDANNNKNGKFSAVVYKNLSKWICGGIVTFCDQDATLVRDYIKNEAPNIQGAVLIRTPSTQGRYKLQSNEAFLTMEQCLVIDNTEVFNALIDSSRCERVVLVADEDEAKKRVLGGEGHDLKMPQFVMSALDTKGTSVTVKSGSSVISKFYGALPAPQWRMASQNGVTDTTANAKEAIKELENKIANVQREMTALRGSIKNLEIDKKGLERALADVKQKIQAHESEANAARIKLEQVKMDIVRLSQVQEEFEHNDSSQGDVLNYDAQIEEDRDLIRETMVDIVKLKQELNQAKTELQPFENTLKQAKEQLKATLEDVSRCKDELNAFVDEYRPHTDRVQQIAAQVTEHKNKLAQLQMIYEEAMKEFKAAESVALELYDGKRMENPQNLSISGLEKRKAKLEKELEAENKRVAESGETPEELIKRCDDELTMAKNKYSKQETELQNVKSALKKIHKTMTKRRQRFINFRAHAEEKTSYFFQEFLKSKGQSGSTNFNHEKQEIEIYWSKSRDDTEMPATQVEDEDDGDAPRGGGGMEGGASNTATMSGGERSYATLSLLLAMGNTIECPFSVMDEFDVFMDPASRILAIKQLIRIARSPPSDGGIQRQYIFITPLDVGCVPNGPDIRKLIMEPPVEEFGSTKGQSGRSLQQQVLVTTSSRRNGNNSNGGE